jgi:hypothetical protein
MASNTVKAIRAFRDAVANVDFSPLPGVYDSIPWQAGDTALDALEAESNEQLAEALKERFPWLAETDELDVSGSDVIDRSKTGAGHSNASGVLHREDGNRARALAYGLPAG